MKIRALLLSLTFTVACGGGGSKPAAEPTPPAADPAPQPTETAATAPTNEPAPAPAPPPPAPKLVLGDATLKVTMKSKTETISGEIKLAADGALTATMAKTDKKKKDTKTVAGMVTATGEMHDDKHEVIARIGDDGTVEVRQVMEESVEGKVVKSESTYEAIGKLDDSGVFTASKDGKQISFDDKGKLTGFPTKPGELEVTLTAAPEQREAAMLVFLAMMTATKMTSGVSSGTSAPAAAPAKK